MASRRNPWLQVAALLLVMGLGLGSRSELALHLPAWVGRYAGDAFWALLVFLGFGLLFPTWSTGRVAVMALAFSFAIEFSQLYQAPWLQALRQHRFGALVLGRGFLWSDLLCYTAGVLAGVGVEEITRILRNRGAKPQG